jgi:lipopolysaccharide exporter
VNDDSLKHRVVIGIAWMTTARALVRVLGLISTLVLARLLTPADFGLVAMATAVAGGLELLTLFGFDMALVQRQTLSREHYDSAWTLNLMLGTGLALAVAAAAAPAAAYYREPRLVMVMIVVGARYILLEGANTGIVDFRRNLQFGKDFVMQVGPKLFGTMVTIPLAFWIRDYRALIAGMVLAAAATCFLSYAMHPHRPRVCMTESRVLFRFSRWLLLNNFINFVRNRGADFIVGRALGTSALGIYSLSYEVANLPTTEMVAPINRVLLPGYVKAATDPEQLRDSFRSTLALIAIVILPASIGLAAVADPLVRITLGNKWLETIPLISLLAIAGAGNILQTNTGSVHHALGQPRMITLTGVIQMAILLPLLVYLTYRFGLLGAAWAYVISSLGPAPLATYAIFLWTTPVKLDDLWRPCWRPMVAAPLMFLAVRGFLANGATDSSIGGALVTLLEATLLGAALYCCIVSGLWILAGRPEAIETALVRRVGPLWQRLTRSRGV